MEHECLVCFLSTEVRYTSLLKFVIIIVHLLSIDELLTFVHSGNKSFYVTLLIKARSIKK